jgi:hypothetical protein
VPNLIVNDPELRAELEEVDDSDMENDCDDNDDSMQQNEKDQELKVDID